MAQHSGRRYGGSAGKRKRPAQHNRNRPGASPRPAGRIDANRNNPAGTNPGSRRNANAARTPVGRTDDSNSIGTSNLRQAWVACSMPAFVMVALALVAELLAFGQLPNMVPRHLGAGGVPDVWWPRASWLAFTLGMTIFFALLILVGGVVMSIAPKTFHLRNQENLAYWSHPDHWPLMRQRLWVLAGWLAGFFSLYLAIALSIYALGPTWNLPHWMNFAVMLGGLVAGVVWLFIAWRRMAAIPDEDR